MNIFVNGEAQTVSQDFTAEQLVNKLNLQNMKIAMEVNLEIIPRSQYSQHTFQEGDKVEIVRAIGGG